MHDLQSVGDDYSPIVLSTGAGNTRLESLHGVVQILAPINDPLMCLRGRPIAADVRR
jgi:hypothetical protein